MQNSSTQNQIILLLKSRVYLDFTSALKLGCGSRGDLFFFFLLNCILNLIFILYWGIVTYNVGLVSGVQQSVSVIHV